MKEPIYLDFNATTPVHPVVLEAIFRSSARCLETRRVLIPTVFGCALLLSTGERR